MRIVSAFVLITILLCNLSDVSAQGKARVGRFPADYYLAPLDMRWLLSGNFAEVRRNHLHSGIDVKTDREEGKPLRAAADGYITRINIAPHGFGRVLYITHPNGTTTVYAHMQKFTPEIELYVDQQRHSAKRHSGDFYNESNPKSPKFPVKKGDYIGNAGNSGSSSGPHLHFEIRESASQRPLNVGAMRLFDIKDNLPPAIVRLYYIDIDTVKGVPIQSQPRPIEVRSVSSGKYALASTEPLQLGKCGYFVLETTDRKNDTENTMGAYSVRMKVDGQTHFAFYLDGFLFEETRYVNSLTHYAMQRGSRNELFRLAVQANNRLPVYSSVRNRGALVLGNQTPRKIDIEVEDDNGNITSLSFTARLRSDGRVFDPNPASGAVVADCRKGFSHSADGLAITIPAEALYEPIFYTHSVDPKLSASANPRMKHYSPVYRVHDQDTPLHKAATLTIDVKDVPASMQPKLCFARIGDNGLYAYSPGNYENGRVKGNTRDFGVYTVVADTIPPTATASFANGADLRGKDSLAFTLRDDFSGISSFTATIDGNWIPFEQKGQIITHYFNPDRIAYNGNKHSIVLNVSDNKGNRTSQKLEFVR